MSYLVTGLIPDPTEHTVENDAEESNTEETEDSEESNGEEESTE